MKNQNFFLSLGQFDPSFPRTLLFTFDCRNIYCGVTTIALGAPSHLPCLLGGDDEDHSIARPLSRYMSR